MINNINNQTLHNNYTESFTNFVKAKVRLLHSCLHKIVTRIARAVNDLFLSSQEQQKQILVKELKKYKIKAMSVPAGPAKPLNIYLQKTSSLEFNLQLANEILEDTLNAVPFSANNIDRSREIIEKKAEKRGLVVKDLTPIVNEAWRLLRANRRRSSSENTKQKGSSFNEAKIIAKNMSSVGVGNCWEMAIVGLFKGMEKGIWNIQLERAYLVNGDHTFLVIGRDRRSDPKNYKTWGPDAVVMDAWAGKVYKLDDLQNLYDYKGMDVKTGKPYLKKFDPNRQSLAIDYGNIYTTHELLNFKKNVQMTPEQDTISQNAIELLEKFHQAETLPIKLEIAKSFKEMISHPAISSASVTKVLSDQINHFIELNTN